MVLLVILFTAQCINAQNTFPSTGSVGIGTIAPNGSAALEIKSTSQGLLIPQLTKKQRDAIASPATGLMIYQTNTLPGFYYYSGTAWTAVSVNGANTALSNLSVTSVSKDLIADTANKRSLGSSNKPWLNAFFSGKVGIGVTNPINKLEVLGNIKVTGTIKIADGSQAMGKVFTSDANGLGSWQVLPTGNAWSLTGNAGTNSANNFIGTTDAQNLVLKVNNQQAGFISYEALKANNGYGFQTLNANTTGAYNTATGYYALRLNTTGSYNTATGGNTLSSNTTGASNTATGYQSLLINTTGSGNTATGSSAMALNSTGYSNTATGANSLFTNTTGYNNTATGYGSLFSNSTGYYNTANGSNALYSNTTGIYNMAIGVNALSANSIGNNNTASGSQSMYSNTTGNANTASGSQGLFSNTTGSYNTANGNNSLHNNTTGGWNTANGAEALYTNTTGYFNTATGYFALNKNTIGDRNIANGSYALTNNTTGRLNAATGVDALFANTTGSTNVANGFEALHNNTTGYSNVALGVDALFSNTTGSNNIAIGDSALYNSISVFPPNVAIGSKALYKNTTGIGNMAMGMFSMYNNTTGVGNAAIGASALFWNSEGSENVGLGITALYANQTGIENVAVGSGALNDNRSGSDNTAIGSYSFQRNELGSYNTAIGAYAEVNNYNFSNATAVGAHALATAGDQVMLGSTTIIAVKAAGSFVIYSDARFKKNIKENVPGLKFINQLKPITYNYDIHKLNDFIKPDKITSTDKNIEAQKPANPKLEKIVEDGITAKEKKVYTGFLAQDVEKVADKMHYDFSGVYKPQNDKDPYGLSYADFVVPLVKAVQELSAQNDSLTAQVIELESLKSENAALKSRLDIIEQKLGIVSQNKTSSVVLLNNTSLGQNIPNPFNHTTLINYELPQNYSSAKILITDNSGRTLKEVNISGSGKGSLKIDASTMASGAYNYSLYINERLIGTKQMVIGK